MQNSRLAPICFFALVAVLAPAVRAQNSDWNKSYPLSGEASLHLEIGDNAADIHSCGDCKQIRINVNWNDRNPANYNLTESQAGNAVSFQLKEKPVWGIHIHTGRAPRITVEVPTQLRLDAHASDGSMTANGLQGDLGFHTSDGSIDVRDLNGNLKFVSSDGSVKVHNAAGTLEARTSDGTILAEGRFTGVQAHSSDGTLDITLADGSRLATASNIRSSDGQVRLHLAHSVAADLEVHTSDGHIECSLPLTMDTYQSSGGHNIHGKLNGGGVPLSVHTSDGSVKISGL